MSQNSSPNSPFPNSTDSKSPVEETHAVEQPGLNSLPKSFEPSGIEMRWGPEWERRGYGVGGAYGSGQAQAGSPSFCIQLPPPNVTGTLHMGHAFNQTIMDTLTRYHRMSGFNSVWIPGTDHAGIATQIVVERQLQEQGITRHQMGDTPELARKNFIDKVWQWKEQSGHTITSQMRRMGDSVDWSREYFTMDQNLSDVVVKTFVALYQQKLIYRGKRLVNWDPVLSTAVSDLEVESRESQGHMYYILYPFAKGEQLIEGSPQKGLVIATTRPETLLGDSALAVHPEDSRYSHLIGQEVELPLCNRRIPIIADAFVDPSFGSGVVKITGAHDFNDYACAQRHNLPLVCIFTLDAKVNENAPEAYRGLDRFDARKVILKDLKELDLFVEMKPHKLMLPICARTGQVVEPMLTDQWFIAMSKVGEGDSTGKSIAAKAVEAVQSGEVQFVPENWINTYNQWMNNIQDWCISRQLWWGHQIPAWYDEEGHVYVAESLAQAQAQAPGKTLRRDPDVLDTWYSSAMVPFSTLGWPAKTQDLDLYLPSSVLVTGYDIIFFWVARMIMMTTHFTGKVPFKKVYIHGLVLDANGKKMSKSEGNVLDPVDLIDGIALPALLEKRVVGLRRPETAGQVKKETEKEFPSGIPSYGADALRFTFASMATLGRSINFDSKRCEGYRNFCNKLWNATRFVLMNCEGHDCGLLEHTKEQCQVGGVAHGYMTFSQPDRWIASQLQRLEEQVEQSFKDFRIDIVANSIYDFVWNEFCDWYLEIAKVQLMGGEKTIQRGTRRTLIRTLETLLRLLHPIIPFITEELWQKVAPIAGRIKSGELDRASVSIVAYPKSMPGKIDPIAELYVQDLKAIVDSCRNLRGEMGVSPAIKLPLLILGADERVRSMMPALKILAKLSDIKLFEDESQWRQSSESSPVAVVGAVRMCLHIQVDATAERARLGKEILRIQTELDKGQIKLSNESFVAKAPPAVIEQERKRMADFQQTIVKLKDQLARLPV